MCLKKDIDDVLEQMKNCHDPTKKRRLLEEITPCKTCLLAKQAPQAPCDCKCQQQHQIELMNMIEHIKQTKVDF